MMKNKKERTDFNSDVKGGIGIKLPYKIALRYLLPKNTPAVITIIGLVSMMAIMVGSGAMLTALSVFNGFENVVKGLYNNFNPDLKVLPLEGKAFVIDQALINSIQEIEGVEFVTTSLEEKAMLRYEGEQHIAQMKGVDENYTNVASLDDDSLSFRGSFDLKEDDVSYGVFGVGVYQALGIDEDSYEAIEIFVPKRGRINTVNPDKAANRRFVYPRGSFSIQDDFNDIVFVPIEVAQFLLDRPNEISAIEIKLAPMAKVKNVKAQVAELVGSGYETLNRYEQDKDIYKLFKMEKLMMFLILSFVLLIAAFNITGSILMLVMEKRKDIGVLKALGATSQDVKKIFLTQGLLLSVGGCLIGLAIATIICLIQMYLKPIKIEGSFVIDAYPVYLNWKNIPLIFFTVTVISLLASWIPAQKASKLTYLFKE